MLFRLLCGSAVRATNHLAGCGGVIWTSTEGVALEELSRAGTLPYELLHITKRAGSGASAIVYEVRRAQRP